jgi:hypothetical protein
MRSSRTITLFTEQSDFGQKPTSFLVSILVHGAAISLVGYGVLFMPRMDNRVVTKRYTVRQLDLQGQEQRSGGSAAGQIAYPGPHSAARESTSGGEQQAHSRPLRQTAQAQPGKQTLVQPDIDTHITLPQEIPLPQVVVWEPNKTPVKNIVAPAPQKPPPANVTPSLNRPNEETNVADIQLASVSQPALNQLVIPSNTTPIVVQGPPQPQPAPVTNSQPSAQPSPAAVMSLSDLSAKDAHVNLPPVNSTAADDTSGDLTPGEANQPPSPGIGDPASKAAGTAPGAGNTPGAAPGPGKATEAGAGKGNAPGSGSATVTRGGAGAANAPGAGNGGKSPGAGPGSGTETGAGSGQGDQPSATKIALPIEGHFSSVVVGASLEDQYPEMGNIWHGRMAYTVYLHMGLSKNWILQYSLPRSVLAAQAGSVAHLEAPWPYNIVRPNLPPDAIDADALMIHGFVNQDGRFDSLSIVFPPAFPQAEFVLKSLEQWQFRPASQNGQGVRVEVLLIIPEELD